MFKKKLRASLLHLLLSAIAVSLIFLTIIFLWFPTPFLSITNFKEIATIIITVDLVLGPVLTFVVFNPSKKCLKRDLATIVSIQVIALSYGIYSLFLTHPVYITYFDNAFNVITAKHATPNKATVDKLRVSKFSSPTLAYMNPAKNTRNEVFADAMNKERDIESYAEYYEPYEENFKDILAKSLDPDLVFNNKIKKEKLKSFISKYGKSRGEYAYFPLIGPSKDVIWVIDKKTTKPIDIITVNPWNTASIK